MFIKLWRMFPAKTFFLNFDPGIEVLKNNLNNNKITLKEQQ